MEQTIAIMQPYLFPYIGYFQLIQAVDLFMIHDDVQWIKGGWINRNRILLNGKPGYITLPVAKGSFDDRINQRRLAADWKRAARKIEVQVAQNYKRAICYQEGIALVRKCLDVDSDRACELVSHSIHVICDFLQIKTPIRMVSELALDPAFAGQPRVIEINRTLSAKRYINPIGGRGLYDSSSFSRQGMDLRFLQARATPYPQAGVSEFVPFLSIIDVVMNNPVERVHELLLEYDLVE